jgi:cytosine/adenosine deaminase-related metal-dependent hydrolase
MRASIVRGGKIVSVHDGFVAVPAGARLIDLRDRFVLPGPDRQPRPLGLRPRGQ